MPERGGKTWAVGDDPGAMRVKGVQLVAHARDH